MSSPSSHTERGRYRVFHAFLHHMRDTLESRIKSGLQRFGIDISYVDDGFINSQMYENSLRGAISVRKPFNIVQVGANDGKHNDPIYDFVKKHKNSTNIILIEPIKTVIPYLKENYSYHPSSKIINKAISGEESSVQLYGVDQDYWDNINTKYGRDWPTYRIPTGVTTTNKEQLLQWVSENIYSNASPEEMIEKYNVDVVMPSSIIDESQNIDDVHLLQVDAEGMDDEIVYSFFKSDIYPNIINIECKHFSERKQKIYDEKLKSNGYDVYNYTADEKLAIK